MKSFVGLIFAVALVEFASAVTKEYHDRAVAAKDKCAKEHNIKESEIQEFVKKHKLPETEDGKCMIACYMEEMKLITDGKVNVDEWKKSNKEKWDEEAHVAMADEIVDKCNEQVSPDGLAKCEYGFKLTECGLKHRLEKGLPAPNMDDVKRR
uniref:Odorant-binding protein 19 n=1 Tax=Lygus lineolaris TaxID=50650 RepID=W0HHU7_LYGLI|nr:odorant-binding protein 19 [Lygus lineolaris]